MGKGEGGSEGQRNCSEWSDWEFDTVKEKVGILLESETRSRQLLSLQRVVFIFL